MSISRFFRDRPIFAGVLSVLIFLAGLLSLRVMPISEYPEVVPPSVVVRAQFPGANPKVLSETVATPIEESINGVEGMLYMSSQSTNDGQLALTVTFKLGTNLDDAQVQVQNKLQLAVPLLPQIVQQQGISVTKTGEGFLMVIGFVSQDGRMSRDDIADYLAANIVDPLSRVPGGRPVTPEFVTLCDQLGSPGPIPP